MATETLLSPGVLLQETDKSFITPGVDPSGMAIIGPTSKGPVELPTQVNSYQEFKDIFGTTIRNGDKKEEYFTNLSVKNYFRNGGSSALVVRVVSGAAAFQTASNTNLVTVDGGADSFALATFSSGHAANSSTAVGNINQFSNGVLKSGSADNVKWEIANVNTAKGTFSLIIRRGDDTPVRPIILETFDECSLDPKSDNYIAKKVGDIHQNVQLDAASNSYIVETEGIYPNKSKYIRVASVARQTYEYITPDKKIGPLSAPGAYSGSLPTAQTGGFFGGNGDTLSTKAVENAFGSASGDSGENIGIQGLPSGSYTVAIDLLRNKDEYKFRTLVVPGLNQKNHAGIIDTIIENTATRGDSFFVTDLVPWGHAVSQSTAEAADIDSSFAATYWPWVQVFSSELNRNIFCPASTVIPGVYAKNDSIAAPWFAPAGETRGKLGGLVRGSEKKLDKALRDTLYSNKINPITSFPNSGLVVFGQKTLQNDKSALDRVNVRRMLLDAKETISKFANTILFEQNTEATRQSFIKLATPYLESLVQRQGVYAFRIKMDGQLNTPDVIDENRLVGQVFLQPTKTAEFIVIDFTLTRTGASFED